MLLLFIVINTYGYLDFNTLYQSAFSCFTNFISYIWYLPHSHLLIFLNFEISQSAELLFAIITITTYARWIKISIGEANREK